MHQPERTCVGCRTRRPQNELLRLRRRADGHLLPASRVPAGRSAYLCPVRACYDRAVNKRGLSRGWGRSSYDPATLWTNLVEQARTEVSQLRRATSTRRLARLDALRSGLGLEVDSGDRSGEEGGRDDG